MHQKVFLIDEKIYADLIELGVLEHTKNITRNGVVFNLVTTVRNIDDPYDGVVGGSPNDTAPADYKLVEISST